MPSVLGTLGGRLRLRTHQENQRVRRIHRCCARIGKSVLQQQAFGIYCRVDGQDPHRFQPRLELGDGGIGGGPDGCVLGMSIGGRGLGGGDGNAHGGIVVAPLTGRDIGEARVVPRTSSLRTGSGGNGGRGITRASRALGDGGTIGGGTGRGPAPRSRAPLRQSTGKRTPYSRTGGELDRTVRADTAHITRAGVSGAPGLDIRAALTGMSIARSGGGGMLISLSPAEATQAGIHGERVLVRSDVGETGVVEVGPGEVTRRAGQRHPAPVTGDSLGRTRRQPEVHHRVAADGSQAVGRRVAGKGRSTFHIPLARRPGKDLRRRTGPAQKAGPGGDGVPRPPGSTILVAGAARRIANPVGATWVAARGGNGSTTRA